MVHSIEMWKITFSLASGYFKAGDKNMKLTDLLLFKYNNWGDSFMAYYNKNDNYYHAEIVLINKAKNETCGISFYDLF